MSHQDLVEKLKGWGFDPSGSLVESVPTLDGAWRPASPQLRVGLGYLSTLLEGPGRLLSTGEMERIAKLEEFLGRYRQRRSGLMAGFEPARVSVAAFAPERDVESYLLWQEHRVEPLVVRYGGEREHVFWDVLDFVSDHARR